MTDVCLIKLRLEGNTQLNLLLLIRAEPAKAFCAKLNFPCAVNAMLHALIRYVCMYGFYGAYNCCGLVHQVSGFSNVSVSALDTCRILDCWI